MPEAEPIPEAEPVPEVQAYPEPEIPTEAELREKVEEKVAQAVEEITTATQAGISKKELFSLIRDIVERVAWEVVPELAEAMIKERIARWEAKK